MSEIFNSWVALYVSGLILMEKVSIVDLNFGLYFDASLLIKRDEVSTMGEFGRVCGLPDGDGCAFVSMALWVFKCLDKLCWRMKTLEQMGQLKWFGFRWVFSCLSRVSFLEKDF